jgi:hypothetical protein
VVTVDSSQRGGGVFPLAQITPHSQLLLEAPRGELLSPPERHMEEMQAVVVRHRHGDTPARPGGQRWTPGGSKDPALLLEYSDIGEGGGRDVEEALGAAWRGAGPRTLTNLRRSLQPDMIVR